LIEEAGWMAQTQYEIGLTQSETKYYDAMKEFPQGEYSPGEVACVGAGIGGGFANTKELHVMKFDEAMRGKEKKRGRKQWMKSISKWLIMRYLKW
jgi:hypothetical protein